MVSRAYLICWCLAVGLIAYVLLDTYSQRRAPTFVRFSRLWRADIQALESSGKLPPSWFDIRDINVIGGTPESKQLLRMVEIPIQTKQDGEHRLEVLVVTWEEGGRRSVLVQYDIEDLKTRNTVFELSRTLIVKP